MLKKIVALLMALILVFAMTACAKTEAPATKDPEPTKAAEETQGAEESTEPSEEPTGEVVTLKYYEIGNNDVNTREAVQDAINAYVEPLINANVEFQIISWGDWDNKAPCSPAKRSTSSSPPTGSPTSVPSLRSCSLP